MCQCLAPKGAIARLEALNHSILIADKKPQLATLVKVDQL